MVKLEPTYHITFEELDEIIVLLKNVSDFDLTGYTKSSLKRRIQRVMGMENMDIVDLKNAVINVRGFQNYLMQEIAVNVTEMFRDPDFYSALNSEVLSYLRTFPQIKIWSAGCASGEEVYSLAILLQENKLYDRSFIYGTDISTAIIEVAKKGIYPLKKIKSYSENFNIYNSNESFSKYYTAKYESAIVSNELKKNILFSVHNLASDSVFNEFQLVTCRNVLIYFDLELQNRVLQLLYDSLSPFGFLCLGTKESLANHEIKHKFRVVSKKYNIYQKVK